jgi:hypothetical protein
MLIERLINHAESGRAVRPAKPAAWNIGRCVRMLWAGAHGILPTDPPSGRQVMSFDLGSRIEDAIMAYLEQAGIGHIRPLGREDAVYVPWLDAHVRPDALVELDRGLTWPDELGLVTVAGIDYHEPPQPGELVILEVKSMSDYAFDRACRGLVDDAYLAQCQVYMDALNCRWSLLLAYRKETSQLTEVWIPRSKLIVDGLRAKAERARGDECPPRPYELEAACPGIAEGRCIGGRTPGRGQPHADCGGTGLVPGGPYIPSYPCGYCDYRTWCWGELEAVVARIGSRWVPRFRPRDNGGAS